MRASFTAVFARASGWPARRASLPKISPAPPTPCATHAANCTGAPRFQPAVATGIRFFGSLTVAAARLSPTAPMTEPPNQAADPMSCGLRTRVVRCDKMCSSESSGVRVTRSSVGRFFVRKCHGNSQKKCSRSFCDEILTCAGHPIQGRHSITERAVATAKNVTGSARNPSDTCCRNGCGTCSAEHGESGALTLTLSR